MCRHAARLGFHTHVFESYGKFNISSVRLLRRFLRHHRIEVVHTHGYKTDVVACLARARDGLQVESLLRTDGGRAPG